MDVDFHQVEVNGELHALATLPHRKDLPVDTGWRLCSRFGMDAVKKIVIKHAYTRN
jgi:hypothetical protein